MYRLPRLFGIDHQLSSVGTDVNVLWPVLNFNQLRFGIFLKLFCHDMHDGHELR